MSPGPVFDVYERYGFSMGKADLLPTDLTAPAAATITTVTTGVGKLRSAVTAHSRELFRDGVKMIEAGDALKQIATGL